MNDLEAVYQKNPTIGATSHPPLPTAGAHLCANELPAQTAPPTQATATIDINNADFRTETSKVGMR